ncbi:hypothetical protein J2Z79_003014 [Symbiobacterium terraclitae]|uniref:DNA mismatch repair proteins mutS family domain-containing protein n=1 Tax=Symbiobacterium terraclitae TaxID=557451 RepID=A0ABS4JVI9_9FIRM|nr:MutS family DNA mismatch repair protein [Symbiobacterium terraclitae]MBP2019572.1 hypothetical protein [Symbiobacterium terraclitae]
MQPQRVYTRRREAYERLHERQRRAALRLSNGRLAALVTGLALAVLLYRAFGALAGWAAAAPALILFATLVWRHRRLTRRLRYTEVLIALNRRGEARTAGRWSESPDRGTEFADDSHPYAADLDLFGQNSLFQRVCSAHTVRGRQALAALLAGPPPDPAEIRARQEAVAELARALAWRQRLEAEARMVEGRLAPPEPLVAWARESHPAYARPLVRYGALALPALTLLAILLWAVSVLPWQVPAACLAVHALVLRIGRAERSAALDAVFHQERQLSTYAAMLALLERRRFAAPWLRERQARLRSAGGETAFRQIRRLFRLAERISDRANAVFIVVNLVLLWEVHCMIALEAWKRESGRRLSTWLETLGEIEALASLANIRFEHPDWAMPTVADGPVGLSAREMGHPLIGAERVCNDFALAEPARVAVITGSNMSGKSTFLRTVGVNLVLAYAGAPVCAAQFTCGRFRLWTCMRVADSLEQRISSFYAEILRIKRIVEAARGGQRVFFLLDEIFKGTNSHDRHQGAKALVAQLQQAGALGLVSTHDLELGELERESGGRIVNYHFREYYEGDEVRFDYRLRPGVSTTRNALHLIRLAGIHLAGEAQ